MITITDGGLDTQYFKIKCTFLAVNCNSVSLFYATFLCFGVIIAAYILSYAPHRGLSYLAAISVQGHADCRRLVTYIFKRCSGFEDLPF